MLWRRFWFPARFPVLLALPLSSSCARAPEPSPGGSWRFAGGATLEVVSLPAELDLERGDEAQLKVNLAGAAGCRLDFWLLPADAASAERVRAPAKKRLLPDQRIGRDSIEVESDRAELSIAIPVGRDFHARQAVVEAALACGAGHGRQEVVRGAARAVDPLPARGRPAIAQLGVLQVRPRPTRVRVGRGSPDVDGALDEDIWRGADWHELAPSMNGGRVEDPNFLTWTALSWDNRALYVAGRIRDRDLWAKHRERDEPLYRQEAFEVFLAAGNQGKAYVELQVSARNVLFDAVFPEYRKGDEGIDLDIEAAVARRGTLNRRKDEDRGWSVEMAIPWSELCAHTEIPCTPRVGEQLRGNVFRLEKADRKTQSGYALSPTRRPDFHAWQNAAVLELAAD